MVCFILKPMSFCDVLVLKNKFLHQHVTKRHHCRGHPYII